MQREKIYFEPNVPVVVRLDSEPAGKLSQGKSGDQYQYFLADDKIMWVDPPVREAIVRSGAGEGDEIAIVKRERRSGNKRSISWEVARVEDETIPEIQQARPGPQPAASLAQQSREAWDQLPATAPAKTNGTPAAPATASSPAPAQASPAPQPRIADNSRDQLAKSLAVAVDVAKLAEQYAAERGLAIRFSAEDVRAFALTLMISAERRSTGGAR